jgi:tetratricopeptide (TPR) repeat protein
VLRDLADGLRSKRVTRAQERYEMTGEVKALLDEMVGLEAYSRSDTLQHNIIEHYRLNLRRMVGIASKADANILFVTVASNLKDVSPFKSEHDDGLAPDAMRRFDAELARAKTALASADPEEARAALQVALSIDGRHADAHFWMGQAQFRLGRFEAAEASFQRAIDEDICPLRQLSSMRQIKLDIARDAGLPVVDFVELIADSMLQEHGHRIPGDEYFLDHVHPTIDANRLLATGLVEKLTAMGIVTPKPDWREVAVEQASRAIEPKIDKRMHAGALRNIAKVFNWAGKSEEAGRMAERALELDPTDGQSLVVLGSKAVADGRSEEAIRLFTAALEQYPMDIEARLNLAVELSQLGRNEEALAHYERLVQTHPEEVAVHWNVAKLYMRLEQYDSAVKHYERVVEMQPRDARSHLNLGTALLRQHNLLRANQELQECLRLDPNMAEARVSLARVYLQQGSPQRALDALEEALRIAPNDPRAHGLVGLVLAQKGEIATAKTHLTQALRLDPATPEVNNSMGMIQWNEGRLDEALASFEAEVRINPAHIMARNNLAFMLALKGSVEEAIQEYRRVLALNEDDAMTISNLAWLLATHSEARYRDGDEALRLALRAAALTDNRNPMALNTLAAAYAETGEFEQAVLAVEKAMEIMRQSGHTDAAKDLAYFLDLYKNKQPFRETQ